MLVLHALEHQRRAYNEVGEKDDHGDSHTWPIDLRRPIDLECKELRREAQEDQRQNDQHLQETPHIVAPVVGQRPLSQLSESIEIKLYHNRQIVK